MHVVIFALFIIVFSLFLIPAIGFNVLFLILGILITLLIVKRNNDLKKNIYTMPEDALHITNVDRGGVFKLTGVGENVEELTLKVISKHLYQEGDYYWYELECDKGDGEKVWVEVEDDDETIVSVVLKKMPLTELRGVTKTLLDRIDYDESGSVQYDGKWFTYVESDEAIFYRHCDNKKPEKLYYWDFRHDNYSISVEKWSEKEYLVYYCQSMDSSQITVYSNKKEEK